jgi:23S rRNA pseudouridine1911/1915/1917 synthase
LVRASRLHREGQGFESLSAHLPEITIIYENADFLVINKPAGLNVHGDGFREEKTLVDWLLSKYPELSEVGESMLSQKGEEIKKPGIVHRLDKDTSGVMIIAKNQETFEFLKNQFQNHEVKKFYRAIVTGSFKMEIGEEKIINLPIGRSASDARKRVASPRIRGTVREAVTIFRLIKNLGNKYAYIEAEPKTGRTHQLRAHFKAYNHPIIGDELYNSKDDGGGLIKRQALHAYQLTIKLSGGESHTFVAPLPPDFEQALEKLEASC